MYRRASLLAFALALAGCASADWFSPRVVEIETMPPGASLDLFYLRDNRQVRLEHAAAPARVRLPSRFAASSRDAVVVRAQLDGYETREVQIGARSDVDRVALDLAPAANQLEGVALRYLGGRGALELRTRGKLIFRTQPGERGFRVALIETAPARPVEQLVTGSARPLVDAVEFAQIGRDLYVSTALTPRGRAAAGVLRFRESLDRVRGWHVLAVELAPEAPTAPEITSADAVLARTPQRPVRGCALDYDRALRAALALEARAPGQLAQLRAAIAALEAPDDRRAALQSLIAADLPEAAFTAALDRAEAAERSCDRRRRTPPH